MACGLSLALLLTLSPQAWAAEEQDTRVVVLIRPNAAYRTAAEALVERLRANDTDCELLILTVDPAEAGRTLDSLPRLCPDVIAASGASMTLAALEAMPEIPVVFFMVPNALDTTFLHAGSAYRDRVAGVASDPAPAARIAWIRRVQPRCRSIAVLYSPHSVKTTAALETAGRQQGVEVHPLPAARDQFPAAIDTLNAGRFDAALMIPDAQVYNSPNVQRLLLWGLRRERGVWGFSDKVAKAGSLGAIYSDPAQVGRQAAGIVAEILGGTAAPAIGLRYPEDHCRAVNLHTAEVIGLKLGPRVLTEDVLKFGEGE